LEVNVVCRESTVTSAFSNEPLKLLTPRSRGQSVWAYTSSFGGGLVAGDETRLDLGLGTGARCFVGTQSSTKIYRNPGGLPCSHATRARLAEDSLLVFAPALVQPFADSRYAQRQQFHLAPGAGLALVDGFTSGRPARAERWAFAHFESRNEVLRRLPAAPAEKNASPAMESRDLLPQAPKQTPDTSEQEERIFLDAVCLDPADGLLANACRCGRFDCFAMLLLLGPPFKEAAKRLLDEVGGQPVQRRATLLASASPVADGVLLRLAGQDLEPVERELRRLMAFTCELLGDDPWSRRW
jgi:urease accessory protein